jgi:ABC-2 type transport system permease protein
MIVAEPTITPAQIAEVAEETAHGAAPVELRDVSATARLLDTKPYFAAGMAVFFLMFTVQFGISSLIEERTEGTLPRLLAAPVSRGAIVPGKLLTSMVLGSPA